MGADRLRAAGDRGVVISDVLSRPQMTSSPKEEGSGWTRFLRIKRPK